MFDEGEGISTAEQQYESTWLINEVRRLVNRWREVPNPSHWRVTPETARLLQHWRSHKFIGLRPFFCQVEAIETLIYLTEVAPQLKEGKDVLQRMETASKAANP